MFTADAVSMYTNIPTNIGILTVGRFLCDYKLQHDHNYPAEAMEKALALVMRNNVFSFEDTEFTQLNGTAMRTPPAPPYATLYYAAHE